MKRYVSFVLPTYNEEKNIIPIIKEILEFNNFYEIEIIVVDDDSKDNTQNLVREFSKTNRNVRLISRVGRSGLSSALKEGCLNATGEIIAIMDSDGQHEVHSVYEGCHYLLNNDIDIIIGSRFLEKSSIDGLSARRKKGSTLVNTFLRKTLKNNHKKITDSLSGCFVFKRRSCLSYIKKIDINGFKFLYELLAISKGRLKVHEIALDFKARLHGNSNFNIAVVWDLLISIIHALTNRILPRRAISFGIVGLVGVIVQFFVVYILMGILGFSFIKALPFAVLTAASSNFLINNLLTFRNKRLFGKEFFIGLFKFLLVSSLPVIANIGLASSFYNNVSSNTFLSQMAGIVVVFIWNYAASSKFVWDN